MADQVFVKHVELSELGYEPGHLVGSDGSYQTQWRYQYLGEGGRERWLSDEWQLVECNIISGNYRKITIDGVQHKLHHIILEAFVGPKPEGELEYVGCHKNDDRLDNKLSNLYWGTRFDNMQDSVKNEKHVALSGADHVKALLTEDEVRAARRWHSEGLSNRQIALKLCVETRIIYRLISGRTYKEIK